MRALKLAIVMALPVLAVHQPAPAQGQPVEAVLPLAVGNCWSFERVNGSDRAAVRIQLEVASAVRIAPGATTTSNWNRVFSDNGDVYYKLCGASSLFLIKMRVDTLLVRTDAEGNTVIRGFSFPGTTACWVPPEDQVWLRRDVSEPPRWLVHTRGGPAGWLTSLFGYQACWPGTVDESGQAVFTEYYGWDAGYVEEGTTLHWGAALEVARRFTPDVDLPARFVCQAGVYGDELTSGTEGNPTSVCFLAGVGPVWLETPPSELGVPFVHLELVAARLDGRLLEPEVPSAVRDQAWGRVKRGE